MCVCVTWLIHMSDLTHPHVCVCDMTHSHEWFDSSTCVCVWHDSFTWVIRLIHMCDMTHPYVWHDSSICVWHDSFMCVTWLIHMSDTTQPYVWHDSFICVTWLIHMCYMTHPHHFSQVESEVRCFFSEVKRDESKDVTSRLTFSKVKRYLSWLIWMTSLLCHKNNNSREISLTKRVSWLESHHSYDDEWDIHMNERDIFYEWERFIWMRETFIRMREISHSYEWERYSYEYLFTFVPSSRTVSERTPLEEFVPGTSRGVLLTTVLDEGT